MLFTAYRTVANVMTRPRGATSKRMNVYIGEEQSKWPEYKGELAGLDNVLPGLCTKNAIQNEIKKNRTVHCRRP